MDPMTSSDGLALGAFAGVFGAAAATILSGLFLLLMGNIAGQMMMRFLDSSNVLSSLPPEARAQMEQSMEQHALSIVAVITNFIIHPLFGLLGGLIGYAVFRKRGGENRPQQA
jgi:hypothetical protein